MTQVAWWITTFFLAVALGLVLYFFRAELAGAIPFLPGRRRGGDSAETHEGQNVTRPSLNEEDIERSKHSIEQHANEFIEKEAVEKLKQKDVELFRDGNPSTNAFKVVSTFAEEQEHARRSDKEMGVPLTKVLREELETVFRGTSIESYVGAGLAINDKGQIVVPMEAIPLIAKHHDPIVSHSGTIVIRNLLSVDKTVELALAAKVPFFYRGDNNEIRQLESRDVERLVATRDETKMLDLIEKGEKAKKALVAERNELLAELSKERKARDDEAKEKAALEKSLAEAQVRIDETGAENLALKTQVQTLKDVLGAAAGAAGAPVGPAKQNEAPRPKKLHEHKGEGGAKQPKPREASAKTEKAEKGVNRNETRPKQEKAPAAAGGIASEIEMGSWIVEAAGTAKENYKRFGLMSVITPRNRDPKGRFDFTRLRPFLQAEAKRRGVQAAPIRSRTGYVVNDDGAFFTVEYADILLKQKMESCYLRPYELQHYERYASGKEVGIDEKTRSRYNALTEAVKTNAVPPLDERALALTEKRSEWT